MPALTLVGAPGGAPTSKPTDADIKAKTGEAAKVLGELAEMLPDEDGLKRPMAVLSLCLFGRLERGWV
jgi:hypothetical protein